MCFVYSVVTSNWDLVVGYSGIFNFGHLGFFAIGAYVSVIMSKSFGLSPWIGMFIAGLVTTLAGLLVGIPTLRLRGIYFALFTFAFQQGLYSLILINPQGLTGGSQGLMFIPPLRMGSVELSRTNKVGAYYLALGIFLVSTITLYRVIRSYIGYAFKALRDSEDYAISRGINPYRYKLLSVLISAFFTGVIGSFYAHYLKVLGPAIVGWDFFLLALAMLVIGGLGTLFGPIGASFVLFLVSEYTTGLGAYRFIIIALVMIAALLVSPSEMREKLQMVSAQLSQRLRKLGYGRGGSDETAS
jgi:branched-chain amino acid transport system permease protein